MDEASDLSRRIDELLSGAIDEQVREQRVLAELMIGVRDGLNKLSDRIVSLNESVEAAREASERMQLAPAATQSVDGMSERFESIETAIGELSGTIAALADRPDPAMLDPEEARALFGTTAEAAREAATGEAAALRSLIESSTSSVRDTLSGETAAAREHVFGELLAAREALLAEATTLKDAAETRHGEVTEKLNDSRGRIEAFESRLASIEMSLADFGKTPEELRETISKLMSEARTDSQGLLDRIRTAGDKSAERLAQTADKLSDNSTMIVAALDTIAARFETLQETLLAYLQVRDIALEEERDRVITELLEEFARALDAKQRPLFAAGIRGAWASRKDRKDARKFRAAQATSAPKMPAVSQQAARNAATKLSRPVETPAVPAEPAAPARATGPRPRPVPVEPLVLKPKAVTHDLPPAPDAPAAERPPAKRAPVAKKAAKAPAKGARLGARTKKKEEGAQPAAPGAPEEAEGTPSAEDIGVPAVAAEAATPDAATPELEAPKPVVVEAPAEVEAASAGATPPEPPVDEARAPAAPEAAEEASEAPEPEIRLGPPSDLSVVQPPVEEAAAEPIPRPEPPRAAAGSRPEEAPEEAAAPAKPSRRAAKKAPSDKRSAKLERAARRRAGQRPQPPRASPLPPPPGERPEGPAQGS